ncbi:MAG: hypothetical protein KTR33_12405 [Gammaproteobacteria bacterium]|nr:hypothetical protein [Gammaproteobacteria bacterium]
MLDSDKTAVLFNDTLVRVTPAWLTVEHSSYPIRTIARLDFRERAQPSQAAVVVCLMGIVLMGICLWYLLSGTVPALLAWLLLLVSTGLMLIAAWFGFASRNYYELLVTFVNGETVQINRRDRLKAIRLQRALTEAMDWHVGSESPLMMSSPLTDSASHTAKQIGDKRRKLLGPMLAAVLRDRD